MNATVEISGYKIEIITSYEEWKRFRFERGDLFESKNMYSIITFKSHDMAYVSVEFIDKGNLKEEFEKAFGKDIKSIEKVSLPFTKSEIAFYSIVA